MQFEPGPIPPIDESIPPQLAPEYPGFATLAGTMLAGLDTREGAIDTFLDVIAPLYGQDTNAELDSTMFGIENELALQGGVDPDAVLAPINQGAAESDELMLNAYSEIPAEGWSPVPAELQMPGAPPPTPGPNPATATITNLTHPGAAAFLPGDSYRLDMRVAPVTGGTGLIANLQLTGVLVKDGTTESHVLNLGTTDANGFATYQGSWGVGDVGNWTLTITPVSGSDEGQPALLQFTVNSAPGVAPTSVNVQLFIVNRTNAFPNLLVGDQWVLSIYGPSNSDVVISGTFNSQPLTPVVLGQTDKLNGYGHLDLQGTFSAGDVGSWVELYSVGGVQWGGQLVFTISAA
jgi:hypothetical protein